MADLSVDLNSIIVPIVIAALTFPLTFYLKEYLQRRSEYASLRKKLEKIAGKTAPVIYNPFPGTSSGFLSVPIYKIQEINRHGVTLKNDLMTVYVPASKLLESEIVLPADDYDRAKKDKMKKDVDEWVDALIPSLFDKMIPELKKAMLQEFSNKASEFSAIIGIRVQKALEEGGFEIKRLPGPRESRSSSS